MKHCLRIFFIANFLFRFNNIQLFAQLATNTDPNQGIVNVNLPRTPESAGFEKYGEYSVSEFTGAANISIPIYTLKSRFLQSPISLSYSPTGIKVNQEASWVGLGWDLNAGGRITVETKGSIDGGSYGSPGNNGVGLQNLFNRLGNSSDLSVLTFATLTNPSLPSTSYPNSILDDYNTMSNLTQFGAGEPDIYRANFMGNSITYYFDKITGSLNFIGEQSTFKINPTTTNGAITGWTLTDNEGVQYFFNQTETSTSTYTGNITIPATTTTSWLLTKVVHPTGDYIQYTYTNYGFSCPAFNPNSSTYSTPPNVQTNLSSDYNQNVVVQSPYFLTRLETADVAVVFTLGSRTDIYGPGSQRLNNITVTDKLNGNVVKTAAFSYSYFQSSVNPVVSYLNTLNFNLAYVSSTLSQSSYLACSGNRLRLDSVFINNSTYQPPYRFNYNTITPDKYSLSIDHWGYYNGASNGSSGNGWALSHLIPNVGLGTVPIPNPLNSSVYATSRDCDPNQMQAMSLQSIVYPTGGSTSFVFEPHQSLMSPATPVTGGGLRIKSILDYNQGNLVSETDYTYATGSYEGIIDYVRQHYNDASLTNGAPNSDGGTFMQQVSNGAVNDNDFLVGYPQVTITQKNTTGQTNGWTVKNFNIAQISYAGAGSIFYGNPTGFNLLPPHYPSPNSGTTGILFGTQSGLAPTPNRGLDGKISQEQYFDNSGNLLKSINYYYHLANYTNNFFDVRAIQCSSGSFANNTIGDIFGGTGDLASTRAVKIFVSPAKSYHTLTDSSVEQTYQGSNSITERRYFTYDNTKYFINSQTTYNSDGTSTTSTYQHVSDLISSGSPIINQMWGVNDISPVISTTVTKAGNPLFYTTNPYFNPSTGVYVPQNTQIQIGSNPVETREVYNAYDIYGNLLEKQKPGGEIEDYLWGYDYHYPVAKIVGTNIGTATGAVTPSVLNNPANDAALRTELNKLRGLSNVLVTSYTYNQALGTITSETDPAGHTSFYNYDGMGRLSYIQDQDKNILKRFDYNYSGQPINNTIPAPYSNVAIPATTFTKSPACAAGLITPTFSYSVPAGKYTSFVDQPTVDNLAQSDLNTNGQAGANALPCLATMSCLNTTTMPYTIVFTNTATAVVYTFSINPSPSVVPLGNIPVGTYNISMTPSATTSAQLNFNGITYTGSTFTLSGVSISSSNAFTLQPNNTGPCSFTMASGYTSPTNGISTTGGVSNGYLVFYSGSSIVANTSYVVATIKGGCVPSAMRSFNVTASGNTFAVTVSTSGQMTIKLTAGASSINANVTINFSSFSYAL